ncbi:hypothetical protein [Aurantiacibacter marinus]|uniref:Uncharacterized protein n=1 Tax=Aurantiacibacter marinus TaxID=874156 RepID=A0A0H0XQT9_9SPHN|nr:hypothetical protein [Aurantiacibacter marinus]KLI64346.1 hypothetical protein AAV99_01585 [Aurantiacibacter marinus]
MATVFALSAIVGFAPNSISIITGTKENPPLLIHMHAAAMSLWMVLLVAQSALASRGQMQAHMKLGVASMVLAPIVILLMLVIALPAFFSSEVPLAVQLLQSKRIAFFGGCIGAAIWLRKSGPEAHKRLMFIGSFAVLDAAFFRMTFLPDWGLDRATTIGHLYMTALLIPFLIHDLMRSGRIHIVFWITVPLLLALHFSVAHLW